MALAIRFQATPNATIRHHSGRTYVADANGIVDVPLAHADGVHGQGTRLGYTGATADRPVPQAARINWPPKEMYDTTLAKRIFWTGASWVDDTGAAV